MILPVFPLHQFTAFLNFLLPFFALSLFSHPLGRSAVWLQFPGYVDGHLG